MSLAKKTVLGVAWTIGTNLGSRLVGLVGTLLLARYLDPNDYGEVMAASIVAMTAQSFSSLGLGQYLVVRPKESARVAFHVTFYSVLFTSLALLGAVLFAPYLGPTLKVHNLSRYLPPLAAIALMDRISGVPERLLYRDMRFKLIGINNAVGDVVYTIVSLLLVRQTGGMSIVWGNMARSVFRAVVIFAVQGRAHWLQPTAIRRDTSKELFAFGLPLSVSSWAGFAARRWDNMVMSYYFGPGLMGTYNYAYNLAAVPATQVGEQIGDVLLTSFAHLDGKKRRESFVRAMRLLSLLMFPVCLGLGAVAETLVAVAFNVRWRAMGPMLTVLSAVSLGGAFSYSTGCYLQVIRKTFAISILDGGRLVLMLLALVALCRFGPLGACAAVGGAFVFHALVSFYAVEIHDEVPLSKVLGALAPSFLACFPMVAAVLAVRFGLGRHDVAGLILEIGGGALGYALGAFVFARSAVGDLVELARKFMGKAPSADASATVPTP